jgi:FMN phosphatase YigB (HAD superfamily)
MTGWDSAVGGERVARVTAEERATVEPRLTFLIDVDNTLLDNDAGKREMDRRLIALLGERLTARFWELYEVVRDEEGMVNMPLTVARFDADLGSAPGVDREEIQSRCRALADLVMGFPHDQFLFPRALEVITHLQRFGRVAILSDGDPTYQPSKIWRTGLYAAVDGAVLVFDHKDEHLAEVVAAFPADHYVLIEDKPEVISTVRARLTAPLTTVLLRQGKYAATVPPGPWAGAHLTLAAIDDLLDFDAMMLISAGSAGAASVAASSAV